MASGVRAAVVGIAFLLLGVTGEFYGFSILFNIILKGSSINIKNVFFNLAVSANPDAKRLYDDLLSNYNKLVRPVANVSDALTVKIKLKLSQLIDVVTYTS